MSVAGVAATLSSHSSHVAGLPASVAWLATGGMGEARPRFCANCQPPPGSISIGQDPRATVIQTIGHLRQVRDRSALMTNDVARVSGRCP